MVVTNYDRTGKKFFNYTRCYPLMTGHKVRETEPELVNAREPWVLTPH